MIRSLFIAFVLVTTIAACADRSNPIQTSMDAELSKSMQDFNNRTRYRVLDIPTIKAIPDEKVEQAVMDYVDYKIGGNYSQEQTIVDALSPGVRALYITWWLEAEVNNGGFNQYFWNSAGQFAGSAVKSLEFFGASEHAALMSEALLIRQAEAQTIARFKSAGTLEAFSDSYKHSKLRVVDDKFFKTNEKLSALRIAKIRAHPELFIGK